MYVAVLTDSRWIGIEQDCPEIRRHIEHALRMNLQYELAQQGLTALGLYGPAWSMAPMPHMQTIAVWTCELRALCVKMADWNGTGPVTIELDSAEHATEGDAVNENYSAHLWPVSEPPPGTVLRLDVRHEGSPTPYAYITFQAVPGRWYTTGDTRQGVTWDELSRAFAPRLVCPVHFLYANAPAQVTVTPPFADLGGPTDDSWPNR